MDKNLPFDRQVSDYDKMLKGKSWIFRIKVYGFKVKIYQIMEQEKIQSPKSFLTTLMECGWKIIYLYRDNAFEHVLSNIVAEELKTYHHNRRSKKHKYAKLKLLLDTNKLLSRMEDRLRFKELEEDSLSSIPHLKLAYEELAVNTNSVCCDIYSYLGLEKVEIKTSLQKTNTKKYSELIINFNEVLRAISQSGYEKYILKEKI